MFYLTQQGISDIKRTYPNDIGYVVSTVYIIAYFLFNYAVVATITFLFFHEPYHMEKDVTLFYFNLATMFISFFIITNSFVTIATSYTYRGTVNSDESFKSFCMRGKFKLGFFVRGSLLRHCVFTPIFDSMLHTVVVVTNAVLIGSAVHIHHHMEPKKVLFTFLLSLGANAILGVLELVFKIKNGKTWSTELTTMPMCCGVIPGSENNNGILAITPQDEDIVETGPHYRSFVV